MKVSLFHVAGSSFATIATSQTTLGVLLDNDKPHGKSLADSANALRAQAERMFKRAELMEQAARQLSSETPLLLSDN